jgi:hypothetical protein
LGGKKRNPKNIFLQKVAHENVNLQRKGQRIFQSTDPEKGVR